MTRDEALLLLPFHANGTLEPAERAAVDRWLAEDADLAAELAMLRSLRGTIRADGDAEATPGEAGLARLLSALPAEKAPAPPAAANLNRPLLWRVAAAVLLAVVLGQAIVLSNRDEAGFELAGAAPADFTLAVRPQTSESELRALLLMAGVEFVSGPSSLGLYGLRLLDGTSQAEALAVLQSRPDIVERLESGR